MTNRSWPDLAGRIEGGFHVLPVRVYYEDTDFSGAVYHANYLKFCERGRSDVLRLLGIDQRARWEGDARLAFVVTRLCCAFLRPAGVDDLLEVETRLQRLTGVRLDIDQRVMREGDRLFEAEVTVALVGRDGKPARIPADIASALARLTVPVTRS
ncbi:MAG: tol-pal system-associated acyl-CoA thioesterase [Hyphomicrobiales bacterium]